MKKRLHEFHIPVMGIGFTIDTPLKVAKYGISSVVSIGDDILLEKLRKHYATVNNQNYIEITTKEDDSRAKRITAYLNLINDLVNKSFNEIKNEDFAKGSEINKYFDLLPETSTLKKDYYQFLIEEDASKKLKLERKLRSGMECGKIDVNIMTKLDKVNYNNKKEALPQQFNDAHAALRGFALSNLNSSIVLSAGLNPRLFAYMSEFADFFPNAKGQLKKKIILKVSDYRSAVIQGKFLAKKGLFVSEYRIESGLNCGGHAFATKGFLMGPILEEFKTGKKDLENETYDMCLDVWRNTELKSILNQPEILITAQGGIGTQKEHLELLKYYNLNSTGWGTPFLLVPEAVNIDEKTLELLLHAEEKDLYLSNTSPLGVKFNTLKGNSKDWEKQLFINKNRPGSSCPKKFLALNTEFSDKPICTASRQYQDLKIKDLKKQNIAPEQLSKEIEKVTDKTCLCVGLGTPVLLVNDLDTKVEGSAVSVCPGPNMAYFDKVMSLKSMVGHIYGKFNMLSEKYRPHMFIKELEMYVDYLKKEMEAGSIPVSDKQRAYFNEFKNNLLDGIDYYKCIFSNWKIESESTKQKAKEELIKFEKIIGNLLVKEAVISL